MADNSNYPENNFIISFYAAGAAFVSGVAQSALEAAYIAETTTAGSVMLGLTITKVTELNWGQSKIQFGFKMPWLTTKAFLCLQSCMGLRRGRRWGSISA